LTSPARRPILKGRQPASPEHIQAHISSALDRITTTEAGAIEDFFTQLQPSIDAKKIDAGRDEALATDTPIIQNSENEGSGEEL
jgi:hypothetical protein